MTSPVMAIDASGVGKLYRRTADASLLGALRRRGGAVDHWALRDIDLHVARGESIGVLGHNGAGKTTLLRLLAGVTSPTEGRIRVVGRSAPLIGVGVGFHDELTGRENVFVNGALLGRTRRQLHADYDSIIEMSGLDDVLDTPVKFYSSGMRLRLAFSVAMHTEPDVLLVDELLAVGDAAFQARCFDSMRARREMGTTIVLVTHAAYTVRMMCERGIVLAAGEKVFDGDASDAVGVHNELLGGGDPGGGRLVSVHDRVLLDSTGREAAELLRGEAYHLRYRLRFHGAVPSPQVYFTVFTNTGETAYQLFSAVGDEYASYDDGDEVDVDIAFGAHLGPGTYQLTMQVLTNDGRSILAQDAEGLLATQLGPPGASGIAQLSGQLRVGVTAAAPAAGATRGVS